MKNEDENFQLFIYAICEHKFFYHKKAQSIRFWARVSLICEVESKAVVL